MILNDRDWEIRHGDVLDLLQGMDDQCVQTCVTSPPYWGLRDYGLPPTAWPEVTYTPMPGSAMTCCLGLESTPEAYVAHLVLIFREVWRVLRDDGTVFLNLGDCYSVGSNFTDCFNRVMERRSFVFGNAATIGITAQGCDVPLQDNGFPYRILLSLFGIERVTIKQRNNDFCQVLHTLANPCYCWIGSPVAFLSRNIANLDIVLDAGYDPSIIISNSNADRKPEVGVLRVMGSRSSKSGNGSLSIEETGKPVTEVIADGQTVGNAVTFNSALKRLPDIYFVDQPVTLGDRFHTAPGNVCDLRITKATEEQFTLSACGGRVDLAAVDVSHFFASNSFGSLVSYKELYDKANRLSNTTQAKQEMGIPEMVKRALMEDGWICRSTIIWAKPNPMPESVTDRPTKAHEYLFLLSKSAHYYYDAEAIREERVTLEGRPDGIVRDREYGYDSKQAVLRANSFARKVNEQPAPGQPKQHREDRSDISYCNGRNKRDVWTIATHPFPEAHFATFPPALVEPCILAGSSPKACPVCGAPWRRVVERQQRELPYEYKEIGIPGECSGRGRRPGAMGNGLPTKEIGWAPTCSHDNDGSGKSIVLDPFSGSGTAVMVALRHGRKGLGLELNEEYVKMSKRRIINDNPLFNGAERR